MALISLNTFHFMTTIQWMISMKKKKLLCVFSWKFKGHAERQMCWSLNIAPYSHW